MLENLLIIIAALITFFMLGILFTIKIIFPNWINKILAKEKDMSLDCYKDISL